MINLTPMQERVLRNIGHGDFSLTKVQVRSLAKAGFIEAENDEYICLTDRGLVAVKWAYRFEAAAELYKYGKQTLYQMALQRSRIHCLRFDELTKDDLVSYILDHSHPIREG